MKNFVYYIQSKLFNFIVFYKYLVLKLEINLPEHKLCQLQNKKSKVIARQALKHDLYKEKFKKAGLTLNDIKSFEDLNRISPLTKEEYRNLVNVALENDKIGKYKHWQKDHTSGSTGIPLHTCLSPVEYANVVAQLLVILNKNGYRIFRDSSLDMGSPVHKGTRSAKSFLQKLGLLCKYRVSTMDTPDYIINEINRNKPTEICAGKSILNSVLRYADENNLTIYPVKFIVNTAESMDDISFSYIEKFFGKNSFIDTYASIESGIMAYTMTNNRKKFFLNQTNYLYNIYTNDKCEQHADNGLLFITNLFLKEFPMINYRQGDYVESYIDNKDGKRYLSVIKGRSDDYILTKDGRCFSFHNVFAFMPKSKDCDQYRIIQEDYEHLRIILVKNKYTLKSEQELEREYSSELTNYLKGASFNFIFEWVDEIPIDPNGKIRVLISKVDNKK